MKNNRTRIEYFVIHGKDKDGKVTEHATVNTVNSALATRGMFAALHPDQFFTISRGYK
jgi:hypothetical protein